MNKIRLSPEGDIILGQKNRYLLSVSFAWEETERKTRQRAYDMAARVPGRVLVLNPHKSASSAVTLCHLPVQTSLPGVFRLIGKTVT